MMREFCIRPFPKLTRLIQELSECDEDSFLEIFSRPRHKIRNFNSEPDYIKPIPTIWLYFKTEDREECALEFWLLESFPREDHKQESLYDFFQTYPFRDLFRLEFVDDGLAYFTFPMDFCAGHINAKAVSQLVSAVLRFYGVSQMSEVDYELEPAFLYEVNYSIVLISALHGSDVWKKAVKIYPDKTVVFMGDYFSFESEKAEKLSVDNFIEIVKYARQHSDCHLLLSDADLSTMKQSEGEAWQCVRTLVESDKRLFSIMGIGLAGHKAVTLTNSPITTEWCLNHDVSKKLINTAASLLKISNPSHEWDCSLDEYIVLSFLEQESSYINTEWHSPFENDVNIKPEPLEIDCSFFVNSTTDKTALTPIHKLLLPDQVYLLSKDLSLTPIPMR